MLGLVVACMARCVQELAKAWSIYRSEAEGMVCPDLTVARRAASKDEVICVT